MRAKTNLKLLKVEAVDVSNDNAEAIAKRAIDYYTSNMEFLFSDKSNADTKEIEIKFTNMNIILDAMCDAFHDEIKREKISSLSNESMKSLRDFSLLAKAFYNNNKDKNIFEAGTLKFTGSYECFFTEIIKEALYYAFVKFNCTAITEGAQNEK